MAVNWTIISHIESLFMEEGSIIFEMQDSYWQLEADTYKIREVVNMPSYIVSDWLWSNRKPLNSVTIDAHIIRKEAETKYDSMRAKPGSPSLILESLRALKRDLLIGLVLKNDSE